MAKDKSLEILIERFLKRGGKINKYYLQDVNKSKKALVYFNGWFSGQNVRMAIMKAFGKK